MPRLSILLPTYNGARYLPQQLESIVAQSDPDFELLVMDDGSGDDTVRIIDEFARRDRRVRRLPAEGNAGQVLRLGEMLPHAGGTFLGFADQDDHWHPERNATLLDAIADHDMAFGASHLIDADGAALGATLLETLGLTPDPQARLRTLFEPLASAHAAIFRRARFHPGLLTSPVPFDWLMSAAALHGGGITYSPTATVHHRLHEANQMNSWNRGRGGVAGEARRQIATRLRRPAKLRFWLMLDALARCPVVAPANRAVFHAAAQASRHAWYGTPGRPAFNERKLRAALRAKLHPLAGSLDDRTAFDARLVQITTSIAHPRTIGHIFRETIRASGAKSPED